MAREARMEARIARRLLQKKKQLDAYRPLEPFMVQRLHQDLRLLATYHSNAIEGNTLSLRETQMVLEYGITVDGHPLREYLEATNHAEAFDALPKLVERPITVETVEMLHRLVMDKIDPHAGELRPVSVYIRGAPFTPPPAKGVPLYLAQWVHWLTSDDALHYDPVTCATIAHHDFETLHPFTDGNGRVGRLLLNLMLMQDGYPPALVLREWRPRYIQALQQAYVGEYSPLVDLVGLAVEQTLDGNWLNDHLQLCAQALCLEERQPGKPLIVYGYIYYVGSRRRVQVRFTRELRDKTRATIVQAFKIAMFDKPPAPLEGKLAARCPNCSLLPLCLPEEVKLLRSKGRG